MNVCTAVIGVVFLYGIFFTGRHHPGLQKHTEQVHVLAHPFATVR